MLAIMFVIMIMIIFMSMILIIFCVIIDETTINARWESRFVAWVILVSQT